MSNSEESNSKKAVENEPRKVTSLNEFLDRVQEINSSINGNSNALFPEPLYRGQSNAEWDLSASLFRYGERFWKHEQEIFQKIIAENPTEFIGMTDFQKLAHIQHHGFPTRLIDVTFNPLVALFFACEGETGKDGEVSVFKNVPLLDEENPVIQLISSFALKGKWDDISPEVCFHPDISKPLLLAAFSEKYEIVRERDAIWEKTIKFEDPDAFMEYAKKIALVESLNVKLAGVRPSILNERMKSQQGAFLLCGMNHRKFDAEEFRRKPYPNLNFIPFPPLNRESEIDIEIGLETIIIEAGKKETILNELMGIGVDSASIYPDFLNKMRVLKDKMMDGK